MFSSYAEAILNLKPSNVIDVGSLPNTLEIGRDGNLSIYYIPFDYVNPKAKLVLVGITPGFTQMSNALQEAQKHLKLGADQTTALIAAKKTGAFSGSMRPNLIAMLDHLKVNKWLGINTCASLFEADSHLVHTTSALRNPVFINGENYNGSPNMIRHPLLRKQLTDQLVKEIRTLNEAVIVPLGPKVSEVLEYLTDLHAIDGERVLAGMPHPSGANAERISYFLGKKERSQLSIKTDPDKIDKAKATLERKMAALIN